MGGIAQWLDLLPVMVGYNGSQCSDTYSVAHQMDFLTQNVFDPATKQTAMFSSCAHSLLFLRNEKNTHLSVLRSIWQQSNHRGKEHKKAYSSEGKCYPGGDR